MNEAQGIGFRVSGFRVQGVWALGFGGVTLPTFWALASPGANSGCSLRLTLNLARRGPRPRQVNYTGFRV